MSEWKAVVDRNECHYLYEYNLDTFLKNLEVYCDLSEKKTLYSTQSFVLYTIMSECCHDNFDAKFVCHVVYSNLKNKDCGVTVVSKFTGKSSHSPIRRTLDDNILPTCYA